MSAEAVSPSPRHGTGVLLWLAWLFLVGLVTWALLSPVPPKVSAAVLPPEMTFSASKAVHLIVYAAMTVLAAYLPGPTGVRFWLWGFLALHAGATEYLQLFVEGRTGSVRDVVIDLIGLGLGVALVEWLRSRRREKPPTVPSA
ncbi:MAG: VanZ family protein [Gemmataceae bacterium]